MSESQAAAKTAAKAPERPKYAPARGGGPHGPHSSGEKAINFIPSLKRLMAHLSKEVPRIILVVVFVVIGTSANAVGPVILGKATDVIYDASQAGQPVNFDVVGQILLLAAVVYLANSIFQGIAGLLINGIVQRTVYRMRKQIEAKIDKLPLRYFDNQPRGELLSRVTNDVDNISQSLQQTLSQVLSNVFMLVAVIAMMFYVSWLLALVALITIPLAILITTKIGKRSQKLFAAVWKNTGQLNSQVEETYTGHALVKVFGRQQQVAQRFHAKNQQLFEANFGAQFISGIIMPCMFFVGNLNYVAIAVIGGLQVAAGNIGLGSVQAFIQYSRMFTHPITQLASMANLLQSGVASAERVFEVLDSEEEVFDQEGTLPLTATGRVEFEHVSFSYDPLKPLITDLSLVAQPGATVAIVGPTGAGKTTLVNLIMRFYELDAGRITLDGVDISSIPRRALRSHIGMVLQDTWLFGGTIRDNIAYGRVGATEEQILAAAKATYVDRFVRALPDGYDTVINDEASNVSAGEKQLITIARAFIGRPSLLIMDEATSSVDTRTELLLQRAMNKLRADRTSFVIAHRLSTIRDADLILVMENGAIVEQGTHGELLGAKGAYFRLYQSQFSGALTERDLPGAQPGAQPEKP
ncbi:MAG: ABC transporter ATP-binding protein/permease [Propionibacteriaceae bacterium]|jgi:ATP-binding cassette subfamily B protein|nr:ABC transporter ATP-binding protein/permease [Propionibacteriaceae bacterium]